MTYYLDANIILRIILQDNLAQTQQARHTLAKLVAEECTLLIEPLIIAEVLFVACGPRYTYSRKEIVQALLSLLEHEHITTGFDQEVQYALELFINHKKDFPDCYLTAKARQESGKVVSFDRDFDELDQIVRLEPS